MVPTNRMLADFVSELKNDQQVSGCNRKKVACMVLMDDQVSSVTLNGPPLGNKCIGPADPCGCVHAELKAAMAMVYKMGVMQSTLHEFRTICTHSPCLKCAQALLNATSWGVHLVEVVYLENSNIPNCGLSMLEKAGIKVTLYAKTI